MLSHGVAVQKRFQCVTHTRAFPFLLFSFCPKHTRRGHGPCSMWIVAPLLPRDFGKLAQTWYTLSRSMHNAVAIRLNVEVKGLAFTVPRADNSTL